MIEIGTGATRARNEQLLRQQLVRSEGAPAGAEVHEDGAVHEVQPGEWPIAIARDYSALLGETITWQSIRDANRAAFDAGFHPGATLRIPGLDAYLDARLESAGPPIRTVDGEAVHRVRSGDTLSGIASRYRATYDIDLSWQDIHRANRDVIGDDPNVIRPGQQLALPGVAAVAPTVSRRSIESFGGQELLTQVTRVRREDGTMESVGVLGMYADATQATWVGDTVDEALERFGHPGGVPEHHEAATALVRAGDGLHAVPLFMEWLPSAHLSDADRFLHQAIRAGDPDVVAYVLENPDDGRLDVRRFDE